MNVLLKNATIIDPSSKHHLKKRDILIENGVFSKIASSIDATTHMEVVNLKNLHVSQGWFDTSVSFGEPGFEERETLENGIKTAALSGFTGVAINTNTQPVPDNKGTIQFLKSFNKEAAVTLYPNGSLTRGANGEDLAELFDLNKEHVETFYDYKQPIKNPNLLKIALQYVQNFNGKVQSFPLETAIAPKGMVHEEHQSTMLGLKGIPTLAETLQITRDLYILEYTGGSLHIPTISTAQSVKLIKEAKKKGLSVTCSVAITNLILTDEVLHTFDTNYKLMPPLRSEKDRKALIKALKDGTIDYVTSDHNPVDIEHKNIEFDHAQYGSIGLESFFGALLTVVDLETAILLLTKKWQETLSNTSINEGNSTNITLFNPSTEWVFTKKDVMSSSKNAALLNVSLKGKAYGVYHNHKLVITS